MMTSSVQASASDTLGRITAYVGYLFETLRPSASFEPLPVRRDARLGFRIALGEAHQHADPAHPLGLAGHAR